MKNKDKLLEDFFDFLLVFANSDIENMEDEALVSLLFQYERNMAQFTNRYPVITDNRYAQIMAGVASEVDVLVDRRLGLMTVKRHTQGLLDAIMKPSDKALIKMSGKQEVALDKDNQFAFHFTPAKFNADELDWKDENTLLDLIFIDLIRTLDLEPGRFNNCERCTNYFYQPTAMEKKYCSMRCSNAARQSLYQSKKAKEEGKPKPPQQQ